MEWKGSEHEKSGVAVIRINDATHEVKLQSFDDFLTISHAIDNAYENGKAGAVDRVKRLIASMFRQNFSECE